MSTVKWGQKSFCGPQSRDVAQAGMANWVSGRWIPCFQWKFGLCEEEQLSSWILHSRVSRLSLVKEELTFKDSFFLDVNAPSKTQQDKLVKILGITTYLSVFFLLLMKSVGSCSWTCFNDKPNVFRLNVIPTFKSCFDFKEVAFFPYTVAFFTQLMRWNIKIKPSQCLMINS